jgi:hypothetical protein
MTPALHSLWTVRTSSNPRAIWRVDAIDGDRYTLTLVRLDPENHRQDGAWFRRSGVSAEPMR